MPRKAAKKKRRDDRRPGWLPGLSLDPDTKRRVIAVSLVVMAATALLAGSIHTFSLLETYVNAEVSKGHQPRVVFVDLPGSIAALALSDLEQAVLPLLDENWVEETLCERMGVRVGRVGWVEKLRHVRRCSDARFEVSCRYREPRALVEHGGVFYLVDGTGVRLPGSYRYDPSWMLVDGVAAAAPAVGRPWEGDDLRAALTTIKLFRSEPFSGQIKSVIVSNFRGRVDRTQSHVELGTDHQGGRIRWGSAPGSEIEENAVSEKMAILRENFRQTGRVDRDYLVIDISTFPNGFSVPG